MPRVRREEAEGAPARVREAVAVADREERKQLLSAILRDQRATGAEAVAAARLLEAMEVKDVAGEGRGLPPPTSRPEQVARICRVLTAAGPEITCEALDILARRSEVARETVLQNRAKGLNPHMLPDAALYKDRIRLEEKKNERAKHRKGKRSERDADREVAGESAGLHELHPTEAIAGKTPDDHEQAGDGVDRGAGSPGRES